MRARTRWPKTMYVTTQVSWDRCRNTQSKPIMRKVSDRNPFVRQASWSVLPHSIRPVPNFISVIFFLALGMVVGRADPVPGGVDNATVKQITKDVTIQKPDNPEPD